MRDLTKSVTSYTWALSVFGVQQMFNLLGLGGTGSWQRSTKAFTNVTEATTHELGDTMRAVFRSGDALQRGMVDLVMAPFSGNGSVTNAATGAARAATRGFSGANGPNGGGASASGSGYGPREDSGDAGWSSGPASGAGAMPPQPPAGSAPPSSDPSLGWGPMPR